jgi:hypothetical protein
MSTQPTGTKKHMKPPKLVLRDNKPEFFANKVSGIALHGTTWLIDFAEQRMYEPVKDAEPELHLAEKGRVILDDEGATTLFNQLAKLLTARGMLKPPPGSVIPPASVN